MLDVRQNRLHPIIATGGDLRNGISFDSRNPCIEALVDNGKVFIPVGRTQKMKGPEIAVIDEDGNTA
jgi:hypothetical protein